ncbi:hypothetical protein MKEN_01348100 [Mycena kentingensis (nom. inval.)]|nr:hypothetical protein MKEN_01348100 [Mycena kentingensis (nom. inval.)]
MESCLKRSTTNSNTCSQRPASHSYLPSPTMVTTSWVSQDRKTPKLSESSATTQYQNLKLMWFIQSLRDGNEKQRYSYLLFGSRYLVGAVVGCSSELSPNERHIIHSAVLAEGGSTEVGRPGPTTTHFVIPQDNYDIKDIEIATAVQYMATGLQIVIPPFFTHHLPHKMLNTDTTPYLKLSTSRAFSGGTLSHWMHEQIVLLFEIYLGEPGKKFWNSADPEHHGSRDFGICWNCSEAGEIVPSRDGKESCCASCYSRAPNGIFCCICRSVGPDLRRRDNRTVRISLSLKN